jgi:hypothetical protein
MQYFHPDDTMTVVKAPETMMNVGYSVTANEMGKNV